MAKPSRPPSLFGILASPGDKLQAESGGTFYNAKVVQVSSTSENIFVLVHFLGWNERYDERIPVGMGRLRPMDESAEAERVQSRTASAQSFPCLAENSLMGAVESH